ncbi:MAG: hypothetical protein ACTSPB_23010, partial [Candidatus Thorarchaeota archaeon]
MGKSDLERRTCMITLIIGVLVTFFLLILPGYILVNFFTIRTKDHIERILYGLVISMSLLIIVGFVFSSLQLLRAPYILAFMALYFSIVLMLYVRHERELRSSFGKIRPVMFLKNLLRTITRSDVIIIVLFIIAILLCSAYSQHSQFPTGYDRGNHFGDSLFIAENGERPDTHPGSYYDPFYFQGPNILISMITISSLSIATLDLDSSIMNFDNYLNYGEIFNIVFSILISLGVLAVYAIGRRLYDDWRIGVFASLFFVSLMGYGIANLGSIGTNLGFIFIAVFLVMLITLRKQSLRSQDAALLVMLVLVMLLTHLIAATFAVLLFVMVYLWDIVRREFTLRRFSTSLLLIGVGIASWILLLVIFAPDLLNGIIDEIFRKQAGNISSNSVPTSDLDFFVTNLESIISNPLVLIILPFFFMGVVFDLRKIRSYVIPLAITSFILALMPILPFVKTMSYIAFPIAILTGIGFIILIRRYRRTTSALIVCMLVATSMSISINYLDVNASSKQYYDYDSYQQVYNLSEWLNDELGVSYTVVIPDSGAPGHVLNALADGKVLIAEPRYTDLPS